MVVGKKRLSSLHIDRHTPFCASTCISLRAQFINLTIDLEVNGIHYVLAVIIKSVTHKGKRPLS